MSRVVELLYARRPQVAVLALMSFGFAGCSADMSTRLSQQNSFSNPFAAQESTGSVRAPQAAPSGPVERRDLPQYARPQYSAAPQYQSQPLPAPSIAPPRSYPTAAVNGGGSGVSGGGRGVGSYAPPSQPHIESTGSTPAPRSIAATNGLARDGGTSIIVGTSDTLEGLSKRYNVSTAAILHANGYKGPRALSPGQSLIIPKQTATAAAAPVAAPKPVAQVVTTPAGSHYVNRGDTVASVARANRVTPAELARANKLSLGAPLKPGTKLIVPGSKSVAAASPTPVAAAPVETVVAAPATKVASAEPVQKVRLANATTTPAEVAAPEAPAKVAEATGALPSFRWPVRGRVITSYGAKTNGKSNDGINVAVPEGTPIKAAEDGVVAYSGNELKGYGNLVLVRHSNGYVTAYAHASELMVKRGETIKRGQTIAKSGQSGEVGSPQLHFEIRKGSSPVDPAQFLNGG
jgi:murein DD-endopeptidase MepM/ murein hydrolase activator NlpD